MVKQNEVLRRCERWSGDPDELHKLADIIQNAFNADQDDMVEEFCLALLEHSLPALYKARMYAYLSANPAYHEDGYLQFAQSYIETAVNESRALLGWVPAEVKEWADRIKVQRSAPLAASPELSLEGLSLGGMDGTLDSGGIEVPHDEEQCGMCRRMKYGNDAPAIPESVVTKPIIDTPEAETPEEAAQAKMAQAHRRYESNKVQDIEAQKLRHQAAKIPKSHRMRMASSSFQAGAGTRGTLRSKKSMAFLAVEDPSTKSGDDGTVGDGVAEKEEFLY